MEVKPYPPSVRCERRRFCTSCTVLEMFFLGARLREDSAEIARTSAVYRSVQLMGESSLGKRALVDHFSGEMGRDPLKYDIIARPLWICS